MGKFGFFISFEGIEGSGKSSHAQGLREKLENLGIPVVLTREPGGTPVGERIREILINPEISMEAWTEVFLFFAQRYENTKRIILPALQKGYVVISDRYSDSTIAYQGFGRNLPIKLLSRLQKFSTLGLKPNLTFLLDLPPEEGITRKKQKSTVKDRFENEEQAFHQLVRKGYLVLAHRAKKRIILLDSSESFDQNQEKIFKVTLQRLWEKNKFRKLIRHFL